MLSFFRNSPIQPSPEAQCLEEKSKKQSSFSQAPSPDRPVPSGVPSLEAREEAHRYVGYKRIFVPPEGQKEEAQLFSRFIELYWDRISSGIFGQKKTLEKDLETLRLQCENEMSSLDEGTKNDLRLKLVQDCGPLFLKSFQDPIVKNELALKVLSQSSISEKDKRKCIEALKHLDTKQAQELLGILENWIPLYLDSNLGFCKYILNTIEDKLVVKSLVLRCFEKALYIGRYEPLIEMIEDPVLKNDICFELIALPQLNHNARKAFLAYIQPQTQEDTDRRDRYIEDWILCQMHPCERILQDLLPFIQDESLKACLILLFLSKRPLTKTIGELIKNEIRIPCILYWLCLVIPFVKQEETEPLYCLKEAVEVSLQGPFPNIADYSQAKAFITRFLRYPTKLEQETLELAFRSFLDSLEKNIREEILYPICLDPVLHPLLREFAARQIEDPILSERYLKDIQENVDRKRLSVMKLACPHV